MPNDVRRIAFENARIGFRNFSGKEGRYNPKGRRNFCIFIEKEDKAGHRVIDHERAEQLRAEGWNVRYLNPRNDEEDPMPYLQVSVRFDNIPPTIILVTGSGQSKLCEEEVSLLDWADITNVDLIVTPYVYDINGKHGIKAYCKSLYVTIEEDEFEKKYRDIPSSAANPLADDMDDIPF